jgi:membrane-bound lytic murein transglycosylase B
MAFVHNRIRRPPRSALQLIGGGAAAAGAAAVAVAALAGHPAQPKRRPAPARTPDSIVAQLDRAEQIIDSPSSSARQLARAGLLEQLATGGLAGDNRSKRTGALASLTPAAAATMRANVDAEAALTSLTRLISRTTPGKSLPRWRITQPPGPGTLLQYFRAAQKKYGLPWEVLAAIELVETRFGRIHGLSPAGAEGPMQFMPDTWARYGAGDVDNPRQAILAAGRYLAANGAPADIAGALYHYNQSHYYVRAVEDYANRMRTSARAYYGYYQWQVLYAWARGTVLLPIGYPKVRPTRPALPTQLTSRPPT